MQKTVFIQQKEEQENKGLDFEFLKAEGIKLLQDLTGDYWTDFNAHDPGITILEQLCYALTDVAFRTDFPIPDLLGQSQFESPIFKQPADIFTVEPLTINDLRKVFLDEIQELKNIWFVPTTPEEHSLKGLFKIYADLSEVSDDISVIENVKEKIKNIFASRRNMCEDVEIIEIAKAIDVSIAAQIEIDNLRTPEHILAEIYFALDKAFNPDLKFYSLKELRQQGKKLEDIFEGCLLKHGFIRDEDLKPKIDRMPFSEISKIMMQVQGVVSVKNMAIRVNNEFKTNQIELSMVEVANLIFGKYREDDGFTIQFFKGSLPVQNLDRNSVLRKFNELKAGNKRIYHLNSPLIEWTEGRNIQLKEYFSLQNQFPIIYGIGEDGIPNNPDDKRRAQAKQLKGYLMIFEQILTNYLGQLAKAKDLFSPETDIQSSYFHQFLDTIPDGKELYQDNYYQDLPKIMAKEDNFLERRNRFLDFFLAIHGENWKDYSLSEYLGTTDKALILESEIKSKKSFLNQLIYLGQNRGQAFDYSDNLIDGQNFSGAEVKLLGLLGLYESSSENRFIFSEERIKENWQIFEIYESVEDYKQWISLTENPFKNLSIQEFNNYFDWIDEIDLPQPSENVMDSIQKLVISNFKKITTSFFREGINTELYRVGQFENKDDFYLFIKDEDEFLLLGKFPTYQESLQVIIDIKTWLEKQNSKDETLFIIEHILLRPALEDQQFGFYVLDEAGNPALKSVQRFNFSERQELLKDVERILVDKKNYSVERRIDGDFEISFKADGENWELVSLKKDISVQKIHEYLEELNIFLSNQRLIVPIEEKLSFYIQTDDNSPAIDEDYFNFHVSVIFPAWSSRFASIEFQEKIQALLQECLPANVMAEARWFSIEKMKEFEYIYKTWADQKRLNLPDLKEYEKKLLHFLYS
ncbi:MAG: hypothetical protein EAZ85_04035 [Bacteroidetes bacterium]|nr:MAG: hypothetical protein EAZ85_04035 [Bacteroidota bacterium]TAG90714.1 MAG: hypothetical protein EAZ20_03770 [Bacteroidota bacterium]